MNLTKKQTYDNHYKLWDWLYHNPSKNKADWHRWEYNGGNIETVIDHCFLCKWFEKRGSCKKCLLKSGCKLYYKWVWAKSPKPRKKYAKLIRDIVL